MLAGWYERNGAAREVLRVGDQPDPVPGRGEVRVRLRASAVNPSDVKARAGSRPVIPPRVIPNSDGAGEIDRVGPGVSKRRLRQRVWTYNGQWQRASGTSAQYIALPAGLAVPLPRKLDWAQGACLGIPVMTAHRCLFADGPIRGMTVLVAGGAGVVGHYAVQLARWAGARVIATYATAAAQDFVLPLRLRQRNITVRMVFVYTMPDAAKRQAIADIRRWVATGRPKFAIAARFPLAEIAAAHETVESGKKIGHVILDIP